MLSFFRSLFTTDAQKLAMAVVEGDASAVESLLVGGANPNTTGASETTVLHDAIKLGNVQIVMLLLIHGADYRAVDTEGHPALHASIKHQPDDEVAILEALLDMGASLKVPLIQGGVADKFAERHNKPIMKNLIEIAMLDGMLANIDNSQQMRKAGFSPALIAKLSPKTKAEWLARERRRSSQ